MDYKIFLNKIKKELPDKAIDIIDSLELLRMVMEDTVEAIGDKVNESFAKKDYNKIPYYSELAEDTGFYESKIQEIIAILDLEDLEPENDEINSEEEREIPDYDKYRIDTHVEHSLHEDFTHKRPYGFKLADNHLIETRTWQEMLINLCELLIKTDEEKMLAFENLKHMNGKKKKYFSKESRGMRAPKKVANKLYVETNQSANSIRNLIIKVLKEYGFKAKDFKVYLRADYSELN